MKKIVQTLYYDKSSLAEHGFETEKQKASACCIAELLEEVRACKTGSFGMVLLFVSEADMLGDRPITVWSGFPRDMQVELFEDYMIKRLKLKSNSIEGEKS